MMVLPSSPSRLPNSRAQYWREISAVLALKALGGAPPFTWFVNGQPVGEADLRRQSAWKPDGAGFARVSVMDARGATDSVLVRLE